MSRRLRIAGLAVVVVLGVLGGGAAFAFFALPGLVESTMNNVIAPGPYTYGPTAREIHQFGFTADLHSDSLLWNRDLLTWGNRGHVDIPRLRDTNVALQVFSAVTKTPKGQNYESNGADSDNITSLVILQRWPQPTWTSLLERALHQSRRLHTFAEESRRQFMMVESQQDLAELLWRRTPRFERGRSARIDQVGGVLAIEGLHCLEGKAENLDVLYEAGFRIMGLSHFFDNELGGSAHGLEKGGLTEFGREIVRRMEEKHIIVDLAHASPAVIEDVLAMATRPVIVSHTGVRGVCDNQRNLSDDQIKAIAANGGLIGIGFWDAAVCDVNTEAIARSIRYVADLVGVEHVAFGSDFDGATTTPFDVTGLPKVSEELLLQGMSEEDITKVIGGNVLRFLEANLPDVPEDEEETAQRRG